MVSGKPGWNDAQRSVLHRAPPSATAHPEFAWRRGPGEPVKDTGPAMTIEAVGVGDTLTSRAFQKNGLRVDVRGRQIENAPLKKFGGQSSTGVSPESCGAHLVHRPIDERIAHLLAVQSPVHEPREANELLQRARRRAPVARLICAVVTLLPLLQHTISAAGHKGRMLAALVRNAEIDGTGIVIVAVSDVTASGRLVCTDSVHTEIRGAGVAIVTFAAVASAPIWSTLAGITFRHADLLFALTF
jgi:hypothetical protein